ncbi:MAG: hypothetical protein KatS3mg097_302 [Candidatus Parcubacteria bacterium]|nr:MAG: hypothetical protein KatS3mg097_302 [Candidatus Parcubacteria bacterium]
MISEIFGLFKDGVIGIILIFYKYFNDLTLAIIVFTLVLKILTLPFSFLSFVEEKKIKKLQPKIKEIFKKYKGDIIKQNEELNKIYRQENYKPLLSIFYQLIPMFIIIVVLTAFNNIIKMPNINKISFNFLNLSQKNVFLFIILLITQLLTIREMNKDQRKIFLGIFILIAFVLYNFPAIIQIYLITYFSLSLIEKYLFNFYYIKKPVTPIPKNNP